MGTFRIISMTVGVLFGPLAIVVEKVFGSASLVKWQTNCCMKPVFYRLVLSIYCYIYVHHQVVLCK